METIGEGQDSAAEFLPCRADELLLSEGPCLKIIGCKVMEEDSSVTLWLSYMHTLMHTHT